MSLPKIKNKEVLIEKLQRRGYTAAESKKIAKNLVKLIDLQYKTLALLRENTELLAKPKSERVKTILSNK